MRFSWSGVWLTLRRRGFVDVYVDLVIVYAMILVFTVLCLSVVASHAGA
jgi:hypothetical protein